MKGVQKFPGGLGRMDHGLRIMDVLIGGKNLRRTRHGRMSERNSPVANVDIQGKFILCFL
jgi:hypothetical protein